MKIGLTGSIACGKSTVAAMLREAGYHVADADAISRALTAPGGEALPAIRDAFGDSVFLRAVPASTSDDSLPSDDLCAPVAGAAQGELITPLTLDRRKLGALVFGDEAQRARLNAILHPLIIERTFREVEAHDAPDSLSFADVPLLYECHMQGRFDRVWVVSASRNTQLTRLAQRDGLSQSEAAQRIDAQMPLEEKCARADAIISTDGSLADTRAQLTRLLAAPDQRRQP